MYEDQLNESKTKVEELQRQLMDVTSQKARAQTESGQCPALKKKKTLNNMIGILQYKF